MVMKSIDFKSLLIGILGTALVMVLMGQSSLQEQYDVECVTMPSQKGWITCKRFDLNSPSWKSAYNPSVMMKWEDFLLDEG